MREVGIIMYAKKASCKVSSVQGLLITMVGYLMIGFSLIVLHTITCFLGYRKLSRALGLCYVVVKVFTRQNSLIISHKLLVAELVLIFLAANMSHWPLKIEGPL